MTTLGGTPLVVGLLCLFLGALLVLVIAQGGFAASDRGLNKTLSLVDSMAGSATSTTGITTHSLDLILSLILSLMTVIQKFLSLNHLSLNNTI